MQIHHHLGICKVQTLFVTILVEFGEAAEYHGEGTESQTAWVYISKTSAFNTVRLGTSYLKCPI
jgi:hypothetical protein